MNLGDIRTYVRDILGEDSPAWFSNAMLNRFINETVRSIYAQIVEANENHFGTTGLISLVAGTELYNLPADFYRLVTVYRVDQSDQLEIKPVNIGLRHRYLEPSGFDPVELVYYLYGSQIGLLPIPQSAATNAVKLWYVPSITALSGDSDTLPAGWPEEHHEVVPWGVLMRVSARDKELLPQYGGIYGELKTSLINAVQTRQIQEARHIIDTDTD